MPDFDANGERVGFKQDEDVSQESIDQKFEGYKHRADEHLKKYFRPEFINRLDDTIFFKPLSREGIEDITRLELGYVSDNLAEQHREVTFDDKVVELVVEEGFSPTYGARNIKRTIQKQVEDPLSELILMDQLPDKPVRLTIDSDGNLAVDLDFSQLEPADFKPEEEPKSKN